MRTTIQPMLACMAVVIALIEHAHGAIVAYYYDSSYVDTGGEAQDLSASLAGLGHSVVPFSGTSFTDFSTALSMTDILVIPELERGSLLPSLDAATRNAIVNFVNSGGGLLVVGDGHTRHGDLLNGLFGFSLIHGGDFGAGVTSLDTIASAGTPFADGPAMLPNVDATRPVRTSSLPSGALSLYHDDEDHTAVFGTDLGSGRIGFLAFDWYLSPTPSSWTAVLGSSVTYLSERHSATVPEPFSIAVWCGVGAVLTTFHAIRRRGSRLNAFETPALPTCAAIIDAAHECS